MISLDQVFLLEQKVESAVAKIQQLQSENDALRTKCEQLTNALSVKSEQLSTFENDQNQIEDGIKKALDRLNSIENSVLKAATQMNSNVPPVNSIPTQPQPEPQPQVQIQPQPEIQEEEPVPEQTSPSFDTMAPSAPFETADFSFDSNEESENFDDTPAEDSTDGLGFDIF